ncbi:unnamed protein product, partial [Brassica oleracea var. botrytis]
MVLVTMKIVAFLAVTRSVPVQHSQFFLDALIKKIFLMP